MEKRAFFIVSSYGYRRTRGYSDTIAFLFKQMEKRQARSGAYSWNPEDLLIDHSYR
jgi:hypothetical protein